MRPENPRRALPRRRYVYPPAIILTVLVVGGMIVAAHAAGPTRTLRGETAQSTSFELAVQARRVLALSTSLTANCGAGRTYQANWSPTEGDTVHFISHGQTFSTHQLAHQTFPGGVSGQIEFVTNGRLTSPSVAHGTVRMTAQFYALGREPAFCDSGDVPWSVTGTR